MRTSRLSAFFIDCSDDTFEEGVRFWSEAFGVEARRSDDPDHPYVTLPGAVEGIAVDVQRVGAPSRYHVDFAAADVEAEVARFESLGAERVEQIDYWWVMRAPTGHLFCVVPEE